MTSDYPQPSDAPNKEYSKDFLIVADTEDYLVIHKFPGISFHSENNEPGLFERVKQHLKLAELYPVHRLDKVTSGLLVMAKTSQAAQAFGDLFAEGRISKFYLALSQGKPAKKQGTIKGDMSKARRGAWKLARTQNNPAITRFRSFGTKAGVRVFLLKPLTGKTHQIRVAMKSLGSPILGDQLYDKAIDADRVYADRVYLHALALRFELNGQQREYVAPPLSGEAFLLPAVQEVLRNQLTPPWQVSFPGE